MNTTPSLTRSFPFWLLLVGSLASLGYGLWLAIDKLSGISTAIANSQSAGSSSDDLAAIYQNPSWVVLAGAFVAAGLIGLVAVLALAIAKTSLIARPVEVVEAIDWSVEDDEDEEPVAEPAPAAEPVAEAPAAPASEDPAAR